MYRLLFLCLPLMALGCINEVRLGNPACKTRSDCKPDMIGSDFQNFNCVAGQCVESLCGNGDTDQPEGVAVGSVHWEECVRRSNQATRAPAPASCR